MEIKLVLMVALFQSVCTSILDPINEPFRRKKKLKRERDRVEKREIRNNANEIGKASHSTFKHIA